MDRRNALKWLGAAAYGVNIPAPELQSTVEISVEDDARKRPDNSGVGTKKAACRIIGVGEAGCNIVLAGWSSGVFHASDCQADFACVSMGRQSIRDAISANRRSPWNAPIRSVQLGKYGAGGDINVARAAARKHDTTLRSLIDGVDVVILVAGIGGGTGSAIAPILASMADESGALVLGVIVTPFRWELGRYSNAIAAVKALERHSHYLLPLPNDTVAERLNGIETLDLVFSQQDLLSIACIHRLILDGSRFCIGRRSHSA